MRNVNDRYFRWLTDQVKSDESKNHSKLLQQLHETAFGYSMERDDNRFYDGIDLRYHFGRSEGVHDAQIATELDINPCSILEMMVALSIKLENIMSNDKYGDRIATWFWVMIFNLGLKDCTDDRYNSDKVDMILEKFINRDYLQNGDGGLFVTTRKDVDMRDTEIWYQAMIFLEEELDKEN